MNLDTFPLAGKLTGANQLRNAAFKSISFLQINAAYSNGQSVHAADMKNFFLECAKLCEQFEPKEDKPKRGKKGDE